VEFLSRLQELGLTEYEAKVYSALVQYGTLSAKDISTYSGVPQNRVYETIEVLKSKGLCDIIPGSPKSFEAFEPEIAIKNLIHDKEDNLKKLKKGAKRIIDDLNKTKYKEVEPKTKFWVVSGSRHDIEEKRLSLTLLAKKSIKVIISVTKPPKYEAKYRRHFKKMADRGVSLKAIHSSEKGLKDWLRFFESIGGKNKIHKFPLHAKIGIIDRKIAYLESTQGPETEWFLIWTNSKPLVRILEYYFDLLWQE
jgi:sugar-specific transcriptional regulator TrmB